MEALQITNVLSVPKHLATEGNLKAATILHFQFKGPTKKIPLYTEDDTHYHFARAFFPYDFFGPFSFKPVVSPIPLNAPQIPLRDYQSRFLNDILNGFKSKGELVACAPCGGGKTRVAIALIQKLKVKTIVMVPTKQLMRQWAKEIQELLGVEVGLYYGSKKQLNKDIVIATSQSIMKIKDDRLKDFTLAILDEAHRNGAEKWSKAISNTYGYRLLLTATPERSDGLDELMKAHGGEIMAEVTYEELEAAGVILRPIVVFQKFPKKFDVKKRWDREATDHARTFTQMSTDPDRLEFVRKVISNQTAKGHQCLVISKRIEPLETLFINLDNPVNAALITSEHSEKFDEDLSGYNTLLGIESLVKEGLDKPELSFLLALTPMQDEGMWQQARGRISRKGDENKLPPAFMELVDTDLDLQDLATGKVEPTYYLEEAFLTRLTFAKNMKLDIYIRDEKGLHRLAY